LPNYRARTCRSSSQAALLLRNVEGIALEPAWDDALRSVSEEMNLSRAELIRTIITDWQVENSYLPVSMLEEDTETGGSA
jgi:hypothetical protein